MDNTSTNILTSDIDVPIASAGTANEVDQADYNPLILRLMLLIIILSMLILCVGFAYTAITRGPRPDKVKPAQIDQPVGSMTVVDEPNQIVPSQIIQSQSVQQVAQSQNISQVVQNQTAELIGLDLTDVRSPTYDTKIESASSTFDLKMEKSKIPIDYVLFKHIAASLDKHSNKKAHFVVFMTDMQDYTFSNQNLRALIQDVSYQKMIDPSLYHDRIFINWLYNHSRFTNPLNKRYRMYNLHKKYYPIPLEADDYETPLLDSARPSIIRKSDSDTRYQYVPEISKLLCSNEIFLEAGSYCALDLLQHNSKTIVGRYYVVIKPNTSNGLDRTYTSDGLYGSSFLSEVVRDNNLSWSTISRAITRKINKLADLIILEHKQEPVVDGMKILLDTQNQKQIKLIELYQTFGLDIIIKGGEPYVINIDASPAFNEIGSRRARNLIKELSHRTSEMFGITSSSE